MAVGNCEVELPTEVDVIIRPLLDPEQVKTERERLADHWFVHWLGGELYCLRLKAGGPNISGRPERLKVAAHPWLLRARLDDVIELVFAQYAAIRLRPFSFLSKREEIVSSAAAKARVTHPCYPAF